MAQLNNFLKIQNFFLEGHKKIEYGNSSKIKSIHAICMDIKKNYDWAPIFEKIPLIEQLIIDEGYNNIVYQIFPIFDAENIRLGFPLLEQMIRNYLNGSPDRDISLNFHDEYNEFFDYFKNKKDIISRVSKFCSYDNCVNLDSYFKITINKDNINKISDAKYYYCFVEEVFNDKILEFIKRNNIEYLIILNGGNVNFEELKKCNELKFIFDKISKNFYFRNSKNSNLEQF